MKKALSLSLWMAVCCAGAYAQTVAGYGTVTGQIRDTAGDGIPDTLVVITNKALDVNRIMVTTDDGAFDTPALVPGSGYSLKATRKGFVDWEQKDFDIHVGQTLSFRILMQSTETVNPPANTSGLSQVEDAKHALTDLATQGQVESLPDRNRQVETMVLLSPGVTQNPNTGVAGFRGEPSTTGFLTDGIYTVNTHFFTTPSLAPQLPLDSFGEIQTIIAGASTDFGGSMGGIVNAVTRTETGKLHGSVYEFFNDHSFDANPRFAPGFSPSGSQHQAGASAGGSVLGNTLFWYSNLEIIDSHAEGINRITNPLITNSSGTAVNLSNCAATAAQCITAANFINSQLNVVVPRSQFSVNGIAKVDYHFTENHTFSGEAGALHSHAPNGSDPEAVTNNGGLLGGNGTVGEETRFAKAKWTAAISGIAVNEIHADWYRDRLSDYPDTKLFPSTGALGIVIAGTPIGGNPAYPFAISDQHREVGEEVSLTVGNHSIKGGAEYSRSEDWTDQVFNRAATYNYSTLTTFAEDFSGNTALHKNYTTFTQNFGTPLIDLRMPRLQAHLQDSWKVIPRLTLTVGVFFERSYIPQPTLTNLAYYQTGSIPDTNKDFAPRIGLAYALNNRTVVRVGGGSYFQPYNYQLLDALFTGNAIYQGNISLNPIQTGANAPVYPKVLGPTSTIPNTTTDNGASNIAYALNIKFRNPYTVQGTAGIERSLSHDTTLTASYIYSRGTRLWTASDQNLPQYTLNETYTIDNAAGVPVGSFTTPIWNARTSTEYSHVYEVANEGGSWYNGLAVQLRKKMSHGIGVQASYTWSHAIDDVSGPAIPQLGFLPATTYVGNYRPDQGNSPFDQRHRGVVNWTWQPTLTKSTAPMARYIVNGWQISGIATLASSLHETPAVVVSGQQFSGVTMSYTNSLSGSGGWNRAPFLPVGSLLTGPEYDVDARISRQIPITEKVKASLMFEAYNLFNHQYATSVNTIAYTATAGVLKPVPLLGAPNAADGFPYGSNARRAQVALRVSW
jgi:hypothetical protein